jgi:addiction module HigA family antidote
MPDTPVLRVSRKALSELINGRSGISPEMAIRLSKAFGSSAEMWLRMQMNFDLAQAKRRESEIAVERYEAAG